MSHSIVAQRDLRPTGQYLHGPAQGRAVLTSLAQKVKARRRDRCSASERGLCAPDPRVRAWPSKSRALIVLRLVLRAFQEPMAPDSAPAESGGVSSIRSPDLFTSRRRAGASAPSLIGNR